jgi:ComF family protein
LTDTNGRAGLLAPARLVFRAGREVAQAALDLLYPPVCYACGVRPGPPLCDPCALEIFATAGPTCAKCGRCLRTPGIPCRDCRQTDFAFDRARGAARYCGLLRALVRRFKLGNEPHLARPLGDLLSDLAEREAQGCDAVVPVPLAPWKLWWRGYNQAELLAEAVARRLGRPMFPRALRRLRKAGKQAFLTRADRIANARGLYAPARVAALRGTRVVLVDDVVTTGATASACAEALREMGAAEIVAISVGR